MRSLNRWFAREATRMQRVVSLEDALFGGRFAAYGFYRLRYFFGRTLVEAMLHIIEFTILVVIFSGHLLISALIIRTLANLVSSFWWGALETMRGEFRRLHRERKLYVLPRMLPQWLSLAIVCSSIIMLITVVWILLDIHRPTRRFEIFHLYVFATSLRLSLGLMTRTYHSAVYAIRRIYRPFLLIIGIPLLGFLGTVLAWPTLGGWGYPLIMVVMAILTNVITFVYVNRAYRALSLQPAAVQFQKNLFPGLRRALSRNFIFAGAGYTCVRLDDLIVMSLSYGAYSNSSGLDLFLIFYVLSPFVRAAAEWAQLLYFDLKRLELGRFLRLRKRFEKFTHQTASVVGVCFWLLSCIAATAVAQRNLGFLYGLLLIFFVVRSHVANYQIRAFAERRYGVLIISGILLLVSLERAGAASADTVERISMMVLVLVVTLLLLVPACMRLLSSDGHAKMLCLPDWLVSLRQVREPVRIRSVRLDQRTDSWLIDNIALQIGRSTPRTTKTAIIGDKRIVWYETLLKGRVTTDAQLLKLGAGIIKQLKSSAFKNGGLESLCCAQEGDVLGEFVHRGWTARNARYSVSDIKRQFREMFPKGLLFDPSDKEGSRKVAALPPSGRRELMHGAIAYSNDPFTKVRNGRLDVTTLYPNGEIRLIFGIATNESRSTKSRWRSFINDVNVSCACGAQIAEEEKSMPGMYFKKASLIKAAIIGSIAVLLVVPMEDTITGTFQLRPVMRSELRAPVAGFLDAVLYEEGERVEAGTVVARLRIPDLLTAMAAKRAEIEEVDARLRLLESGTRPERLVEQRKGLQLAETMRDKTKHELSRALEEEGQRQTNNIKEYRELLKFAREDLDRRKELFEKQLVSKVDLLRARKDYEVLRAQYNEAIAEQNAREAMVVHQAQSELVEREQDVLEAQSTLVLMEAGTRPEEIEAERAHRSRLVEEMHFLEVQESQLEIRSPVNGIIMTSLSAEMVGQYFDEGFLIFEVADSSVLKAEISLPERDLARVAVGQAAELKAYALPYEIFPITIERISPVVEVIDVISIGKAYGKLEETQNIDLRSGMGGYARIQVDNSIASVVLGGRVIRFFRTEFWW
ncbi:MAG: HlyD family efflux transporter periplasmic adaptor subunit [Pseudomonadota bacterium]